MIRGAEAEVPQSKLELHWYNLRSLVQVFQVNVTHSCSVCFQNK